MSIKEKAQKLLNLSPLMEQREKGTVDELTALESVTLREYDIVLLTSTRTGEASETAIMAFDEFPDKFFFGGLVATQLLLGFDEDDKEEINNSGLKLRFYRAKSKKSGNDVTRISVV